MAKGGSDDEARRARLMEEARQAKIREGTNKINYIFKREFTPKFYNERSTDYRDFAKPQLNRQYKDAGKELTYDLADRGLLDSSVRGDQTAKLEELYTTQRQDLERDAKRASVDARTSVEDARQGLLTTLQATGDAEGAAKGALARADALTKPAPHPVLEDLFLSFTSALGTQAALERAAAAGSPIRPRYNLGLYGNTGSVKVS